MAGPRYSAVIPKPILIGAGLMMAAAMVFAVVAKRLPAGTERPIWAPAPMVEVTTEESLDLRFEDQEDGSVLVIDAANDKEITTLAPGTNGFARSVLRGMVQERLKAGGNKSQTFRLRRTVDGGLALGDPATGREILLAAFGEASVAAFEALMSAGVLEE